MLVARNKSALEALKVQIEDKHTANVNVLEKDLSVKGATQEIYDELQLQRVQIDILVNNTGVGNSGDFADADWQQQEALLELYINNPHLSDTFIFTKHVEKRRR